MGVYTRYLVRQHLWWIAVVVCLVLAIVTPIHVGSYVDNTWEAAVEQGRSGLTETAAFVGLRAADVLAQIFPIAFVLAVLSSEISLSLSGRRLMTRVAGRSLAAGLPALLIVAGGATITQFLLDNYVRPYAVLTLVENRIGTWRQYVARDTGPHGTWLAVSDDVLQAGSFDRASHSFSKVTLYRFGADLSLREVVSADRALPREAPGGFTWVLEDGFRIDLAGAAPAAEGASGSETPKRPITRFAAYPVDLAIDPLWVRFRGIKPLYMPLGDLARLAGTSAVPADQPDYATALHLRFAKALVPGLVCLLVIGTFLASSARRSTPVAAGIGLAAAYLGIVASDAVGVLGQGNHVSGPVAAWLSPLLLAALCGLALRRLTRIATVPDLATLPRATAASGATAPRDIGLPPSADPLPGLPLGTTP